MDPIRISHEEGVRAYLEANYPISSIRRLFSASHNEIVFLATATIFKGSQVRINIARLAAYATIDLMHYTAQDPSQQELILSHEDYI